MVRFIFVLLFLGLVTWKWFDYHSEAPLPLEEDPYINVYNWYAVLGPEILKKFEEETGIKIRYDLYDSNDILEAKLLAGNSGYDVVFPSLSPYVGRGIETGLYLPLDKNLLPNSRHLDPLILDLARKIDPELAYAIPYYWGTLGIAYVEEQIKKRLPDAPVDSYRLLFDPEIVQHFHSCGVSLLAEAVDVYPLILRSLGLSSDSDGEEDLLKAQNHLLKIRPSIALFNSTGFANSLLSGQICIAQAWSGEVQLAQRHAAEEGRNSHIIYVIPKEGSTMWIDAMVIPKDAPHPRNAHKFINFLLRPDISAMLTNGTLLPTTNVTARELVEETIRNNPTIYPPEEVMQTLTLDKPHSLDYERKRNRLWTQIRFHSKQAYKNPMKLQ